MAHNEYKTKNNAMKRPPEGFVSPRRPRGDNLASDEAPRGSGGTGDGIDNPFTDLRFGPYLDSPLVGSAGVGACSLKEPEVQWSLSSHVEEVKRIDMQYSAAIKNKLNESNVLEDIVEPLADNEKTHKALKANPYAVLHDEGDGKCSLSGRLRARAKVLVKFYEELGMTRSAKEIPQQIICGGLRPAVRQCFVDQMSPIDELSFRTIQKLEKSCCKGCEPRFLGKLDQWKEARFHPVAVDYDHLERFKRALRSNVEKGWDQRRAPFIPNGNATRRFTRKDGGNWNVEEFSDSCRYELVFSSGKPRVVTLYSAENTRVLAPLHYSLYDMLKRRGWLLVGEPTDQHVSGLNGAAFLSFDYSSATDNIKREYVKAAVSVLEEQADHLEPDEIEALRVLSSLVIDGRETFTGQPMGSVMSFPLLCVINKTVVDMALTAMLERKEISFREWSGHRLLVNGDDLLTREPRTGTNLRGEVIIQGSKVGLVVNEEKTMVSERDGEINSTYFQDGHKLRKFNASSLWMDAGVEDVLGFAAQATSDGRTFRKVVRRNLRTLAKQSDKHLTEIHCPWSPYVARTRKYERRSPACPRIRGRPKVE